MCVNKREVTVFIEVYYNIDIKQKIDRKICSFKNLEKIRKTFSNPVYSERSSLLRQTNLKGRGQRSRESLFKDASDVQACQARSVVGVRRRPLPGLETR